VSATDQPIVVDLDGTLIATDLLVESGSALVASRPSRTPAMLGALVRGKAPLKTFLAGEVSLDVTVLPYREDVLVWLREQKAAGRRLVLASASDIRNVRAVADHLGIFDEILGTTPELNLRAGAKLDALVGMFPQGFEYVGDHPADLAVWSGATLAHVVGPPGLALKVAKRSEVGEVFAVRRSGPRAMVKALRPHQWVKNALVALPLFTSSQAGDATRVWQTLLAFVVFSLAASGVYVLNDIADVTNDRHHPTKRRRPLASGSLSLLTGWLLWPTLTVAGFVLAGLLLPPLFLLVLLGYLVLTLGYTFWAKRRPVLDVVALGSLYTVRIVAGAAAIDVVMSMWLLTFSLLFFLSLALLKRVSELTRVRLEGGRMSGRGYRPMDLELLSSYGVATSIGAVVVFSLYLNDPVTADLYRTPQLLWAAVPVLLAWLMRAWLWAHRGEMNEDPIVFAIKDWKSLLAGGLVVAAFAAGKLVG
jgi:4-hydroxybenzoate polyprenyltransferase